jgi:DeoR/GlpR family transcriptional regulator of sugar metabolism
MEAAMDKSERHRRLLDLLRAQGRLRVAEAAGMLGVTAVTVRRDLVELQERQSLVRVHGGALPGAVGPGAVVARSAAEVRRIARAAAALIPSGAVVGLNGGAVGREVARLLACRQASAAPAADSGFTIVTSSVEIAVQLAGRPRVRTAVIGGVVHPTSGELMGESAELTLRGLCVDIAVLSVSAVEPGRGAGGVGACAGAALAGRASRVVVAATSAEVGRPVEVPICPTARIGTLVTGIDAPCGPLRKLGARGVDVRRV